MILISFVSLFISVILIQLSSGGLGPLDALSAIAEGFTTEEIGLLGSAHFVGFFVGCWWAPRLIGDIGHSRAFAVFAAAGTTGIMAHMLFVDAYAWSVLRMLSGMCVAGCFTVIEAWLQAKVSNDRRGRSIGVYRVVDLVGGILSQMLIAVLEPAAYVSYNILAIFCCASLLPLALTRIPQPPTAERLRLRPMLAMRISPMATLGVIVAGITMSSFRMVGPIYGSEVGLNQLYLALFLGAFIFGGAIAVYPSGWLADKFDRRKVMIGFSIAASLSCALTIMTAQTGPIAVVAASVIFGAMTFPIYSVASAHANDFVEPRRMVELSSSLLFNYALGAIASPLIASIVISLYGPSSMFVLIAAAHAVLLVFSTVRMAVGPASERKTSLVYMPRTSFLFAQLLKRRNNDS